MESGSAICGHITHIDCYMCDVCVRAVTCKVIHICVHAHVQSIACFTTYSLAESGGSMCISFLPHHRLCLCGCQGGIESVCACVYKPPFYSTRLLMCYARCVMADVQWSSCNGWCAMCSVWWAMWNGVTCNGWRVVGNVYWLTYILFQTCADV